MKKITIIIALVTLTLTQGLFAQSSLDELIAVPLTTPGERGVLEIDLVHGSIEVKGYDGNEVIVKALAMEPHEDDNPDHGNEHGDWDRNRQREFEKEHEKGRGKERDTQGMKRIPSNAMEVEVTERNNRVSVQSNSWNKGINFVVQVPTNFDLQLSTVNGGDILVDNINGTLELDNVNGDVTANNISGSAIIDAVNGEIEASFLSINDDSPMAFTTLNGNVDISFPSNLKATFKMKSDRGEIYSDFDMDVDKSGPKVDRSSKGSFKVTIENWVYGKVNGGGPEFMLNNMNGNIYLRKNK